MPPQNAPRWDPATQRWVTDPAAPVPTPPPANPAPTPGPPAQPAPPPGYEPAPGPPPAPAPGPAAPPSGYEPVPGPPPAPGSAPGHDPGAASGSDSGPAPGYDPASGPAPAPAPAPGYEPAPQPGPGEYGPSGYGPAASEQDAYRYPYPTYPHPQPVQPAYPVPPPPPPPRAAGRWLTPTTAAVAVAALAIGAAAVWFVARDTGEQPPQAGPTASVPVSGGEGSPTPSATDSPSPTGSGSPTPTPSPSPSAGDTAHETVRDAKGFTVAVPAGWLREEAASGVFYRSPDRTALIQVFQVSEPELTPLAAVQGASTYLRAQTTGYQEIRVGPAPGAPEGGELVYEYDSAESHGRRRGVERVFVAADDKKWAVLTAGPAADWTLTQAHHKAALTAFRPTGG
ncbi:hypothetical protein [Streptomyces sp. NPDC058401]|uniref:hypothetical protein n=1 Tax=Streptomyces sp. NPDC058401 TaxID=3346480 RepID=UPI0036493711